MISAFSTLKIRVLLVEGGFARTMLGVIGKTYLCSVVKTSSLAGKIQNIQGCSEKSSMTPSARINHSQYLSCEWVFSQELLCGAVL